MHMPDDAEIQYQVRVNGTLVTDYLDREGRPLRGYIGLQNFPYPGTVRHRNLRIRHVPENAPHLGGDCVTSVGLFSGHIHHCDPG